MAKRFTDTDKYKNPFIRSLQGPYKVLWDYLYHDCDHAGVWIVDWEIAQIRVGDDLPIDREEALKVFNRGCTRVVEICDGERWFLPSFVEFQYGQLNPQNRAHKSVIDVLERYGVKPLTRSLQGRKDKDKDKDKDKEFPEESFEVILSKKLFSLMKGNNPGAKPPDFQGWAKHVDLMLRVDGRTPAGIDGVIDWCQADDFWKTNILSTKKLREKYDQLVVKMGAATTKPKAKGWT